MEDNRYEFEGYEEEARRLNIKWLLILLPFLVVSLLLGQHYRKPDAREVLTLYEDYKSDPSVDEHGVFLIYNAKDYLRFCGYVNRGANVKDEALRLNAALMADISLVSEETYLIKQSDDFKYIKYAMEEYSGLFEGNGYSIKGVEESASQVPMFLVLNREAIVRNLHLTELNIVETEYSAGGLCTYNYGLIENCSVSGLIQSPLWAGGIACYNSGIIKNCVNKAKVVSTCEANFYGAGGIAGINERSEKSPEGAEDPVILSSLNVSEVSGTDRKSVV